MLMMIIMTSLNFNKIPHKDSKLTPIVSQIYKMATTKNLLFMNKLKFIDKWRLSRTKGKNL